VGVWLLSNAALAISIQTLNGLDQTAKLVNACLDDTGYNPYNGSVVVPINGTCVENALKYNTTDLQDKQQVSGCAMGGMRSLPERELIWHLGILQVPALGYLRTICCEVLGCKSARVDRKMDKTTDIFRDSASITGL
jgi:hypothetical protein